MQSYSIPRSFLLLFGAQQYHDATKWKKGCFLESVWNENKKYKVPNASKKQTYWYGKLFQKRASTSTQQQQT